MYRPRSLLILLTLSLLTAACEPAQIVTEEELFGFWTTQTENDETGELSWMAIEFAQTMTDDDLAGLSNVYKTYTYPVGEMPNNRHRGGYEVVGDTIEWGVTWADDILEVGETLTNNIDEYTGESITLSGGNNNLSLVFDKVEALP